MSEPVKDRNGKGRQGPKSATTKKTQGSSKNQGSPSPGLSKLAQLSEMFPDWSFEDLEVILQDSADDVVECAMKISSGLVSQSTQVKSRREVREMREQEQKEQAKVQAKEKDTSSKRPKDKPSKKLTKEQPVSNKQSGSAKQPTAGPTPTNVTKQIGSTTKSVPFKTAVTSKNASSSLKQVPALSQINAAPGKMSWAATLTQAPGRKVLDTATSTTEVSKAAQPGEKEPSVKHTSESNSKVNGNTEVLAPSSTSSKSEELRSTPQARTEKKPGKEKKAQLAPDASVASPSQHQVPEAKMSWASMLAPPPKPKTPEVKPKTADQKTKIAESKPKGSESKSQSAEVEPATQSGESAPSDDKKRTSKERRLKKKSATTNDVTKQVEQLTLPKGPAAEQGRPAQEAGSVSKPGSKASSRPQQGVSTTPSQSSTSAAPIATAIKPQPSQSQPRYEPQQSQQPPQQPQFDQQQYPSQSFQQHSGYPQQQYNEHGQPQQPQQSQQPQQPQQQPQQPQQPSSAMMPQSYAQQQYYQGGLQSNKDLPQAPMMPYPGYLPFMPQHVPMQYLPMMPSQQGSQQGQIPGMNGAPMGMPPAMPGLAPGMSSAGNQGTSQGNPQQVADSQAQAAFMGYNPYGFPAPRMDFAGAYDPYMYYQQQQYGASMGPMTHPDSPAQQQRNIYPQNGFSQQGYYDPTQRWGEYQQ